VTTTKRASPLFDSAEREAMIAESLAHLDSVRIVAMPVLVVEVALESGQRDSSRACRAGVRFENELQMAQMNQHLSDRDAVCPRARPFVRRLELIASCPLRRRRE